MTACLHPWGCPGAGKQTNPGLAGTKWQASDQFLDIVGAIATIMLVGSATPARGRIARAELMASRPGAHTLRCVSSSARDWPAAPCASARRPWPGISGQGRRMRHDRHRQPCSRSGPRWTTGLPRAEAAMQVGPDLLCDARRGLRCRGPLGTSQGRQPVIYAPFDATGE